MTQTEVTATLRIYKTFYAHYSTQCKVFKNPRESTRDGLHVLYVLTVGCWITQFISSWEEITACKAEKIHKMATIFTQNDNLGPFWLKQLPFCEFAQPSKQLFLSQLEINHSQQLKTSGHVYHLEVQKRVLIRNWSSHA